MLWFLLLQACLFSNCDAACISTVRIVVESPPAEPYEVVLEGDGVRMTWACPSDTGSDGEFYADCEDGTFEAYDIEADEVVEAVTITVGDEPFDVEGDCPSSRKCGSVCKSCSFVVR